MRRRGSSVHSLPAVVLVMLMGMLSSIVHGQQYTEAPDATVTANGRNGSHVSALYVLGDSSVDCGDNTLFFPLLHARLSLYPCNGSDATLLPQLIGTLLSLFYYFFSSFLLLMLYSLPWYCIALKIEGTYKLLFLQNFFSIGLSWV